MLALVDIGVTGGALRARLVELERGVARAAVDPRMRVLQLEAVLRVIELLPHERGLPCFGRVAERALFLELSVRVHRVDRARTARRQERGQAQDHHCAENPSRHGRALGVVVVSAWQARHSRAVS